MDPRLVMGSMMHMMGMQVISSPHVPRFKMVQYRLPKTKKARIQKKWRKNPANFRQVPMRQMLMFNGNTLVCHPDDLHALRAAIGPTGF